MLKNIILSEVETYKIAGRIMEAQSSRTRHNKRQRVILHILSEYMKPHQGCGEADQTYTKIIGISCDEVIQSLILHAYLKTHRPIKLRIVHPFTRLTPHKKPIFWYVVTEKGKEAVRLYQADLDKEKKNTQAALDQCLLQQEIPKAVKIITKYNALQVVPIPQLWHDLGQPTDAAIRATEILLTDKLPLSSIARAHPEKLSTLRLQAAEFALSGVSLFDRLGPEQLHPRGNSWLVNTLYSYAVKKASKPISVSAIVDKHLNGTISTRKTTLPAATEKKFQEHVPVPPEKQNITTQIVTDPSNLPHVRVPIRFKITIPFILLALVLAVAGAYVVSQIVFESLDDRFTNQLIEVGKLASDHMVQEEQERLKTLRLLANMDGIAEALVLKDAERLRTLALPVAVNAHEEAIEFLNIAGQSVLSLRHGQGEDVEQYSSTLGDTIFLKSQFVQQVLVHQADESGDKYGGVIAAPWGNFFYVSGPIFDGNNQLVGAILVGKSLDTLVKEFRQDTLAHTTVYDSNGLPLASSLVEGEDHNILTPQQVSNILARQDSSTLRNVTVGSVHYSEILGPWEIRSGSQLGENRQAHRHRRCAARCRWRDRSCRGTPARWGHCTKRSARHHLHGLARDLSASDGGDAELRADGRCAARHRRHIADHFHDRPYPRQFAFA
ncbi:MAG: cache domain-containing protein, partial [Chloroflexota bacterium]